MTAEDLILTVADVNRRLPLVRAIARDAMCLKADVLVRQGRLMELRERYPAADDDESPYSEEVLEMEESLEADEIRIDEYGLELQQVGAELADSELGLVEFASSMDGQLIRLSWMYDEPEVCFWRAEGDAAVDRRPLVLTEQSAG